MAFPRTLDVDLTAAPASADPCFASYSPAVAASNVLIATSQALALAAHNATAQQNQSFMASQASAMHATWHLFHGEPEPPPKVFA